MPRLMRLAKLGAAAVVGLLAVWYQAVLAAPEVKARKALRRLARRVPERALTRSKHRRG